MFQDKSGNFRVPKALIGGIALLAIVALFAGMFGSVFGYVLYPIHANEVGVKFNKGNPYDVVGPGMWTEFPGFFEDMEAVKIEGVPFTVSDPEVLTSDKQRIGATIAGTVHRPSDKETILKNWGSYKRFYQADDELVKTPSFDKDGKVTQSGGLMWNLGQQAMKVCVGNSRFDDAVIGSARDTLRECIDKELDKLASGYGLKVNNLVVPNVELSPEVRQKMDAITGSRLDTQLAEQQKLQAIADAEREKAKQQGAISVEQGRIQEKARQDAITAALNKAALDAQNQVIKAQKDNDLLEAERNRQIAEVLLKTAELNAKAKISNDAAMAVLYQSNPAYVELLKVQAQAGAYSKTDKVIMIPAGTNPYLFLSPGEFPTPAVTLPPQK